MVPLEVVKSDLPVPMVRSVFSEIIFAAFSLAAASDYLALAASLMFSSFYY
jgi:hypothetical protein